MTRCKATKNGQIPFTIEEESIAIAKELKWLSGELERKKQALKAYREQKEFGGFTLQDGTFIGTDKEDQRKIDGAVMGVTQNPGAIINFKTSDGYVQLDAATMTSIGTALFNHVQACHTREMELIEALKVDINTDISTGWPG